MVLSDSDFERLFVIVSLHRCGTHMVKSALHTHPDIGVAGEILAGSVDGYSIVGRIRRYVLSHNYARVGFCVHNTPGMVERWRGFWEELSCIRRVVRLRRLDLFGRAVSEWFQSKRHMEKMEPKLPQVIPVDYFRRSFELANRSYEEVAEYFPDAFSVVYEEVCECPERVYGGLQGYLGVEVRDIGPTTVKRAVDLRDMVANYDEVCSELGIG